MAFCATVRLTGSAVWLAVGGKVLVRVAVGVGKGVSLGGMAIVLVRYSVGGDGTPVVLLHANNPREMEA